MSTNCAEIVLCSVSWLQPTTTRERKRNASKFYFTYLTIFYDWISLYANLYNCLNFLFVERKFKCENNINLLDMGVNV